MGLTFIMVENKKTKKKSQDRDVVNKQEMAYLLAEEMDFDFSPNDETQVILTEDECLEVSKRLIDAFWNVVHRETENDRVVNFHGHGKFLTKERKGHRGRNPHTGREVKIEDHKTFVFEPSRSYRRKMREQSKARNKKTSRK